MPAGCAPARYRRGEVELHGDERVRLAGEGPLGRPSELARWPHSATACRDPSRQRGLNPGERADLVRFRLDQGQFTILETFLNGMQVFDAAAQSQTPNP